jgi:hypothetical protein
MTKGVNMKVSISDAAKFASISRQHLYTKYIKPGLVSVDRDNPSKPVIDTSELLRVFPGLTLPDSYLSNNRQELTPDLSDKLHTLDKEVQALRQQLHESQEREKWLQGGQAH